MMTTLEIDEELRTAALNGDVDFLRKCVASNKPISYYLTYFPQIQSGDNRCGNIFHMAADRHNVEFIREAIRILPIENTQQLLLQSWSETNEWNPLHIAAYDDKEIVKLFLDVYRSLPSLPSDHSKRPWLMKLEDGSTPFHLAVLNYNEEGALELLEFDTELICNMTAGSYPSSILYDAVHAKLSKVALEILRSPHPISVSGYKGNNPLHWMHYFSRSEAAEEIFRLLLRKGPELIKQKNDDGSSPIHTWAYDGTTIWPFKSLLGSHDIIPNIKRVFVDLTVETDNDGWNPLHCLAHHASSEEVAVEIAKLLINIYIEQTSSSSSEVVVIAPWLVKSNDGDTPLSLAIEKGYEKLAMYLLSVDEKVVINSQKNALFLAIENGCHEVAKKILEILDNNNWTELLTKDQQNVLHLAPLCQEDFYTQLIKMHSDLLRGVNKGGITILHSWMRNIKVWLFKYLLQSEYKSHFIKLVTTVDYANRNNPIHCGATSINEDTIHVVKLLVNAYKEEYPYWKLNKIDSCPWFAKNNDDQGPLQLAISNQHENLAMYILSLHQDEYVNTLLDYYEPEHSTLFLAIQNNCREVAKRIMEKLDQESWTNYLMDSSSGENILHLATSLTDENFVTWLVNKAPHFITEQDNNGQSPWDKAHEIGSSLFINAVLKKDPSVLRREPLAWTKACEKGHVLALCAIINHNPGAFRDLCIRHKDSPLHHIKLSSLTDYEEFIIIPRMKELINVQNEQDETPLHRAIRKEDIFLTEILLNVDKIIYTSNDKKKVTAIDLLAHMYNKDVEWGQMCKRNGLDLSVKTTYFQHKTNLIDVRTSLFVVAALLATITFTAGFTLPGGINQDNGDAVLARKASFIVFLLSDTLAFFFSMLVLLCLTWSMVFDRSHSLMLIDRSMVLLRIALNFTLLAFMTGVYIVIARKILWVAILIIVVISSLIIISISINKNVLYKVMEKFPTTTKKRRDPMQLVEMGYLTNEEQDSLLSHHDGQSSPNQRSMGYQVKEEHSPLLSHHSGESSNQCDKTPDLEMGNQTHEKNS